VPSGRRANIACRGDLPGSCAKHANKNVKDVKAGFLVLAPDYGFAGNEEIGDASMHSQRRHASLVFITHRGTQHKTGEASF